MTDNDNPLKTTKIRKAITNRLGGNGMTDKKLTARARELCEKRVREYQVTLEFYEEESGAGYEWTLAQYNSWATHLAEMAEHEGQDPFECGDSICPACTTLAPTTERAPCDFLITKAKRLLGVK
jgi:hypothetical protein